VGDKCVINATVLHKTSILTKTNKQNKENQHNGINKQVETNYTNIHSDKHVSKHYIQVTQ